MQPDSSPGPVGERPERSVEEPEGKHPPNTGARLWGRVRSKLLRQKVPLGVQGGGWLGWLVVGSRMASSCLPDLPCVVAVGFCLGLGGAPGAVLLVGSVHGAGRLFGCFGSS